MSLESAEASQEAFAQLCASFAAAQSQHPHEVCASDYTLAGELVRVRVVGKALAALFYRAFAPRMMQSAPSALPDLTIDLWDEGVTGILYPLAAADGRSRDLTGPLAQHGDESGRWVWWEGEASASWLDRKARHIVGWRAGAAAVRTHERSKPLSYLLPVYFYDQGIHILHAGVVARNGAGMLITGGSGIGKTTTSLCCLLAGLDYLSDDQVAVRPGTEHANAFVAHSIYQSARVLPDHLARFPSLQGHAIYSHDPQDPKTLLFLAEQFPTRVAPCATIRVIALPRLTDQAHTTWRRATRVEALNYMARTSLLTTLGIGRARFEHLAGLLGSAPCVWLELGHDLTQIPPAIEQLLAKAVGKSAPEIIGEAIRVSI